MSDLWRMDLFERYARKHHPKPYARAAPRPSITGRTCKGKAQGKMIRKSQRDPSGNMRYPAEHTRPTVDMQQSALPNSQQFEDTTRTLGVDSKGFHFTGQTTISENHDQAIHSAGSLLYDDRPNTENFIEQRNGARSNPQFKDAPGPQTFGPVTPGVEFTPSSAEPAERGHGTTGPSWWDRIKQNFRGGVNTQSSNLGQKPNEKFQIGLRSSNVVVAPQSTSNNPGPQGTNSNAAPNAMGPAGTF